ncbi:MAG: M56 family metallopeptidase [Planctomycetota bacterium]|jgi:beta-lactamase regulating signal transducer with metallopeptidase domain
MSPAVDALNHAGRLWWTQVLHVTWQGTLLAGIVLLIVRFGRRWPVSVRCGLILIALAKFAVPPMWSTPTGVFSRLGPTVAVRADTDEAAATSGRTEVARISAASTGASARRQGLCWQAALMILHGLGAAAVALWIAMQLAKVARIAARADCVSGGGLQTRFAGLARGMGIRRPVRLLASPEPVAPMAFGVRTPTVLIPSSLLDADDDGHVETILAHELLIPSSLLDADDDGHVETILAHELAHHRRGDLWLNWLQIVLATAWWFNPAVWLLCRTLRRLREDGCDDLLLGRRLATGERYCQALLAVARGLRRQVALGGAVGFAERLHPLGERIRRIMDPRVRRAPRRPIAVAAMMILLAAALLPGLPSAPGADPMRTSPSRRWPSACAPPPC